MTTGPPPVHALPAASTTGVPARLRRALVPGLLGLALAVPFSAPDGTGMQWDEVVLAAIAAGVVWIMVTRLRAMDPAAARPWYPSVAGGALFAVMQLLEGSLPGPALDGLGADDVLMLLGASTPLVTASMLARRVSRTRWPALVVDGAVVTASLLVMTEVLRAPIVQPGLPGDDGRLVLAYGAFAAITLGMVGALCSVSTLALRSSATTLVGAVGCQAVAAAAEAMTVVSPSSSWTAASGISTALALAGVALAVERAPDRFEARGLRDTMPVASPVGMGLVIGSMLSLPLSILLMELQGGHHSLTTDAGIAVAITLMALRLVLRIHEDGRVTEDLVRHEEDFRDLVESSSDGIAIVDDRLHLLFTSPAARTVLGLAADRTVDAGLLDLVVADDRAPVRSALDRTEGVELLVRVTRAGGPRVIELRSPVHPGSDRRILYLRDVTTRRRRELELERMAYTDHLTGLANRARLFADMAGRTDAPRCLLVLDLDGFKAVNDVAGHEAGDQLLVEVARRLHTVVREDDLVARLGGDEFAVLVTGSVEEAEEVAERVVDVLSVPYVTGPRTFAIGASVGVGALAAAGGQDAFRRADAALRTAKRAGKGCVRLARPDPHPGAGTAGRSGTPGRTGAADAAAGPDVRRALEDGAVQVRYSAICRAGHGVELVHAVPVWVRPQRGDVRGRDLWNTAERQGAAAALQRWLVQAACTEVAGLRDDRLELAVSLSGSAATDDLDAQVAAALAAAGLPATRLVLSFTEETLLTSPAWFVPAVETVRRAGVRLCLDRYGMGQSLFALLARVSLDLVRVDLPALAGRDDLDRARQVLGAIAATTRGFDVTTVAGGVSTGEMLGVAGDAGVTLVHGRLLPHDLTIDDVAELLATERTPAG